MECFLPLHVLQFLIGWQADSSQCVANLSAIPPRFVEAYDPKIYCFAFLLTVLCELPAYLYSFRGTPFQAWPKALGAVCFLNLATHPLIIFALPQFWARAGWTFGSYAVVGEMLAPTLEMIFVATIVQLSWRRALVAAITANLFSWAIGGQIAYFIL